MNSVCTSLPFVLTSGKYLPKGCFSQVPTFQFKALTVWALSSCTWRSMCVLSHWDSLLVGKKQNIGLVGCYISEHKPRGSGSCLILCSPAIVWVYSALFSSELLSGEEETYFVLFFFLKYPLMIKSSEEFSMHIGIIFQFFHCKCINLHINITSINSICT